MNLFENLQKLNEHLIDNVPTWVYNLIKRVNNHNFKELTNDISLDTIEYINIPKMYCKKYYVAYRSAEIDLGKMADKYGILVYKANYGDGEECHIVFPGNSDTINDYDLFEIGYLAFDGDTLHTLRKL